MKSKFILFFKEHHSEIIIWILLSKLIIVGFSIADCLGALVLLLTIQAIKVIGYLYPERPDIYHELSLIQNELHNLTIKNEQLESDVTALRFGQVNKR